MKNKFLLHLNILYELYLINWVKCFILLEEYRYKSRNTISAQLKIHFFNFAVVISSFNAYKEWLNDSARQIASAGRLVEWVTPLALPVLQPYRVPVYKEVGLLLFNVTY